MERICNECKETKPLEQFPQSKVNKYGRRPVCRVCYRTKQRESWNRRKLDPVVKARVIEQRRAYDEKRNKGAFYYKRYARTLTACAIKTGRLVKLPCEICGSIIVESHHEDYFKPLEVRWLCKKHHIEYHLTIKE